MGQGMCAWHCACVLQSQCDLHFWIVEKYMGTNNQE
jgi:hypothetical protein